ncbi:NirD/YgiW/YdeI family stress tolerance protein [Spirulina major]|uniref:NirD/YgiW/YdeI family stress tolerance protein n=1 Tax=Spirulina major TaxID=270636 RepID=UPI001C31EA29|nr:NirD/YgiW/YdeI family stress tolerance protein [Spirulina major]
MNINSFNTLGLGAIALSSALVFSEGNPTAIAQSTIRDLQTTRSTTVSGKIVHLYGDEFILDDGTGQIMVEAESRPLRRAQISLGETVTVLGQFEDDENELNAFKIIRANGEEIYIFDD